MKNNLKWVEIPKPKVKAYQLGEEPEAIYVVRIRDDEFMIIHEDAFDLKTGNVEFLNTQELFDKYGIRYETEVETKDDIWTMECFNNVTHGNIMATGIIKNSETDGVFITKNFPERNMRWVAVKGDGDDWVVYVHWAEWDVDFVRRRGDKVRDLNNVKKIINCSEELLTKYRY